jgi:short-subunit dehydrogenase
MNEERLTALVTGASSGIGAVFARRLAKDGHNLILVARRQEHLERLARDIGSRFPVYVEVLPADLTHEVELTAVEDRILAAPNLRLLVNNAGFGTRGLFFECDVGMQDRMHRLHVLATLRLTHAALRVMKPRNEGSIVNVSSLAAFFISPGHISYCATKAWINSFTEGLAKELKSVGSAVRVQVLCPGFTYTEFHDVIGSDRRSIPRFLWMGPEAVVEASLKGLDRGRVVVVPGRVYRAVAGLANLLPRIVTRVLPARPPNY